MIVLNPRKVARNVSTMGKKFIKKEGTTSNSTLNYAGLIAVAKSYNQQAKQALANNNPTMDNSSKSHGINQRQGTTKSSHATMTAATTAISKND